MNRETYIRKVKKQLDCSVKEKEEIVRDLQEIFDSGKEHGKSESQIIKQLGKPQAYAQALGCGRQTMPLSGKRKVAVVFLAVGGLFCLYALGESLRFRMPKNAIGGCDDDDRAAKLVTGKQQRDFWGIGGHLYGCTGFPFTKEEKIRRGILRNNGTHKEKTSGNCCVFRCFYWNCYNLDSPKTKPAKIDSGHMEIGGRSGFRRQRAFILRKRSFQKQGRSDI